MAIPATAQYVSSVKWTAVAAWAATTVYAAGALVRQLAAPTVGQERVFICTHGGTSGGSEPGWTITKGGATTDNTVTWNEITGQAGVNGDATNCPNWTALKNTAVALGQVMKNVAGTFLFAVTTAGTTGNGSEPTWNTTAGQTTADNTVTWTSIGAIGNFTGVPWGAPAARLENCIQGTGWGILSASADGIYIDSAHTQTATAALSLSFTTSQTAFTNLLSVSSSAAPAAALQAGASISLTGTNALSIASGNLYANGISFTQSGFSGRAIAIGNNSGTVAEMKFENCAFSLGFAGGGQTCIFCGATGIGSNAAFVEWKNTTLNLANAGSSISFQTGTFIWHDTVAPLLGTPPTSLISPGGQMAGGTMTFLALDLSTIATNLVSTNAWQAYAIAIYFIECKIPAGVVVASNSSFSGGMTTIDLIRCDSGGTSYREGHYGRFGSTVQDTANYRNGGYSDNGITPLSLKMVSGSTSSFALPLYSPWFFVGNLNTGAARTVTVEYDTSAQLKNGDVWLEVVAMATAGSPLGTTYSSAQATLPAIQGTAGANNPTSGASWTQPGISTPVPQNMSVSFTPQIAGPYMCRVALAKPSTTVWVDENPTSV